VKPFEIITEEDCIDGKLYFPEVKHLMSGIQLANHAEYGPPWIRGPWISLEDVNKLIQEKGELGYANKQDEYICSGVFYKQTDCDNLRSHEALVILRPLEAVEPECKCREFIRVLKELNEHSEVDLFKHLENYCKDCGKDLAKIGDGK
tara:strand:+ start:2060 stop:2503 length:444 start_codon:yes stop_codon:yes gene_type:complete